ncbi:MAG: hypothetical protein PVS3B2_12500 [Candidatus Dormibacteraceae bacterium]
MLETLGLVMDLVQAVAEHLNKEHFEQAVMADELEGDLATLASQLLAAVAVVLYEALGAEAGDHLADARRRDAESLREITCRHRLVGAVQLVEGLEVVLLGPGEAATALDLFDQLI